MTTPAELFEGWDHLECWVGNARQAAHFLASGFGARSCLDGPPVNGQPTVCVPQSQVSGVQQRADTGLTVGVVSSVVALALAASALIVFETN